MPRQQTIRISEGQNIIDVAVQQYASVEGLFELAAENDLSVTHQLVPAQELKLPLVSAIRSTPERRTYLARSQRVNTTQETAYTPEGGEYNDDYNTAFNV